MFRQVLFWIHLVAGLAAGAAIGVMCFTGTALAFEKQLVAWAERDARRVEPPATHASRLTLAEMRAKLRAAQPEARAANLVLQNDPRAAIAFTAGGRGGGGGTGGFYVNPYTGEVRQAPPTAMASFLRTMNAWHRTLGFTGDTSRPRGKLVNGACNLAFCVLAVTGLILWAPRQWSWRALRPVIWFRQNTTSKARDFNWHNAIGFWSAPVLIVLTLTAIPISFQWGGRVINALTGPPASAAPMGREGGGGPGGPPIEIPAPPEGATPLSTDDLVAAALKRTPQWETLTLRLGAPNQAATFTIRTGVNWPRTANLTLALNPYNGEVLRRSGYADLPPAQRVRSWTRFLHTGEALGLGGQLVAGLACLGGCLLVYTGFALAWRRFFGKRATAAADQRV